MRSAGNFSPEWGYLAPAPSFMRTARIVLVATAVGATAGAGVVLSLTDHPPVDADKTASAAAHAIVTSVQAATPAIIPTANPATAAAAPVAVPAKVAPAQSTAAVAPNPPTDAVPPAVATPVASAPAASAPAVPASGVASLSEAAPATDAAPSLQDDTAAPVTVPQQQKSRHHASNGYGRPFPNIGNVLRHLFSARSGTSYYPNR